ncbi:MAG: peptidase M14 [Siphonobacter aquaeclarae]|nr:peptidase M14 [Siphonobacter aquaeclarae]
MRKSFISTLGICLLAGSAAWAQTPAGYADHAALTQRLQQLNTRYKNLTTLQSVGKTTTGKDVWLLSVGQGNPAKKPALLIVANVEGTHLAGTELALQTAEKLLEKAGTDSVGKLLAEKTFYFAPSVNPDAAAQFFAKLKYERNGNARQTDDDRDGLLNEDGPDDLNGDGLITLLRVEDPSGTFTKSKADARVMVKADPLKNEEGGYVVLTEGTDNDKDGQFNEDGEGGIQLGRNFTFDYEPFKPGAGDYPVSEPENRGLIDWLYENKNVYALITFGLSNNLTDAVKFDAGKANTRIVKGWLQKDVQVNEQVARLYNAAGLKEGPVLAPVKGDFPTWAYYHFGKFSFSTPGWWVPKDTTKAARALKPEMISEDANFLRWAKTNNVQAFVDWKEIASHPDFPGKKVEVGGFVPFARWNPPVSFLAPVAEKHVGFLFALGKRMPSVELINVKTETVSPGLNRVTVTLHNKGLLPTHSDLGNRVKYEDRLKVSVALAKNQQILSGKAQQLIRQAIPGNGTEEYTWLISGSGAVQISAASGPAGAASVSVNLK